MAEGGTTAARSTAVLVATLLVLVPAAVSPNVFAAAGAAAPVLPAGFENTKLAAVASPTALAATPDGRLLIATQNGLLRVFEDDALVPGAALDLTSRICTEVERGLTGVAVDPSFATNRFIYVYYTFPKFGTCEQRTASSPVNRVSRFTLSDANTVDLATELVLVDGIPSPEGVHGGGDVQFGKDGYLYVSVGDGGCDYAGDSGCYAQNDAARDQHVLLGKILRVTSTGGIPPTNPFLGADSARCSPAGQTSAGKTCQETFAWGLRNPFRMGFDPNAATTRFFINDVGERTWEEIDLGQAGADYGWNVREGPCVLGSTTNCGPPPAGMTNPLYSYPHTTGCRSVTGAAFVPSGLWPAEYEGAYLYGDYVCGKIFKLTQSGGTVTSTEFASGFDAGSVVSMTFGPWGSSRALYYTTYANGGEVHRIAYVGTSANRAPAASATASPTSGPVPLTVDFDASASSDPDPGDTLTYVWYFGDLSKHVFTSTPTVSHTYSTKGTYFAELYVQDDQGARSPIVTIRVDPGNEPPVPTIVSPTTSTRYAVGQTVTLRGSATDPEDGSLPDSALTWEVILVHDDHTHPYLQPTVGNDVSIVTSPPEDFLATTNSYLVVTLTATDSKGVQASVTQQLLPSLVSVTFDSQPAGVTFDVNAFAVATPRTITSWEAYELNVVAPVEVTQNGTAYRFDRWSDGSTASSRKIVTPASAAGYTAIYNAVGGGGSETQTFSIVVTGDDGDVEKGAATYPPPDNAATYVGTTSTGVLLRRSKTPFSYMPVTVGLLRFDTSALPDGATVTSATLKLYVKSVTSSDGRRLVAEWYPASSWPIDAADWTNTESASAFAGPLLSSIVVGVTNAFELQDLGSINIAGATALRLHVSTVTGHGQAPTGPNDIAFASFDDPTLPEPQLVVIYTQQSG